MLFIAGRPLSVKKLSELTGDTVADIKVALSELMQEYPSAESGVQLSRLGDSFQLTTTPDTSAVVQKFLEEEEKKELTKPSLEALTIIAYRGPITKAELELIRGVNCSLILRNLLIRGLVEEVPDKLAMVMRYHVTFDFLHYLGIREPQELPDYNRLNANENLAKLLQQATQPDETTAQEESNES